MTRHAQMLEDRYRHYAFGFADGCTRCMGGDPLVACRWHQEWAKFWSELGRWVWNFGCAHEEAP